MTARQRFTAIVELHGKTATGIEVPAAVVAALGSGKRPAVTVTIGGTSFRTTIGSMGGRTMIPVSAERREAAGIAAGDEVQVDLELDTAPREVEVPDDLAAALEAAGARAAFDALAPSHRKEHVRAITEAKAPETRQRRIDKAVAKVASG